MTTSEPDGRSLGHRVLQRDGGKPFEGSTAESIKQAEHLLRSGRLEDARQQFRALVSSADIEGEPGLLARAAIGFGGAWVNEIRLTDERAEFLGTLRRALAALGPDDDVSRVRLEARLAAEQYYDGGTNEPVFDALARARGLRGPMAARALGETLSLAHHCMLAPERGADRLEIATELVGVAARSGDTDLAAMGLCWRAVDLYLAGHRSAGRAHEELRVRADDVGALHLSYITDVLDVMRTIRAGELAAAEAAAERTFERGVEVGDLDAVGYFGAHLVTIPWLQGRLGEIRPLVESMTAVPTIASNDWIYVAVEAHAAGDDGDLDACRAGLNRLTVEGLDNLPRWSTWTGMMMSTVEGARHLADREVAAACRLLLSDFADLPVMPSLAGDVPRVGPAVVGGRRLGRR